MKCLIIEDEEVFRIQLKGLLDKIGDIEIVGEAYDIETGIELVRSHPEAELLILDVEFPDGICFDLISQFDRLPKILFITSHEQYALNAFEVNALDYIQKPISLERLKQALDLLGTPPPPTNLKLPSLSADDLVLLCCNKYKYFTKVSEIAAIYSDENYTHIIHSNSRRFVMKKTLSAWEGQLPSNLFVRIGRQQLINISALDRLEVKERGGLLWFKGISDPLEIKHVAFKNLQKLTRAI